MCATCIRCISSCAFLQSLLQAQGPICLQQLSLRPVIDMQLAQPGCHVQHDVAEFAQFWAAAPEISHMNGRPGF